MKNILVLVPFYLPGFKSGGPARSISNQIDALGEVFSFKVVCSDRDLGDKIAYSQMQINSWNTLGKANVFYINDRLFGILGLIRILRNTEFDVLYLNSFFSFKFSILPYLLTKLMGIKKTIILAPRGEFSAGALKLKQRKKSLFLKISKFFNFYNDVIWHASTVHESEDIKQIMGDACKIRSAVDLTRRPGSVNFSLKDNQTPLKIVFVSRVSKIKNLKGALNILSRVSTSVKFDVYGPIEDQVYWEECLQLTNALPINVTFSYCGSLLPEDLNSTLEKYDLFMLPTLGENYGHVIAEALLVGLPVLISDATPWKKLSDINVGWDISLNNIQGFVDSIELCCRKKTDEYYLWKKAIHQWAVKNIGNEASIEENRRLFIVE